VVKDRVSSAAESSDSSQSGCRGKGLPQDHDRNAVNTNIIRVKCIPPLPKWDMRVNERSEREERGGPKEAKL